MLALVFAVALAVAGVVALLDAPPPSPRLLRTPRPPSNPPGQYFNAKAGQIVIVKPGTRHELVELARPWADRRCRYCRRADGRRASDGSCAGCGSSDFDGTEPAPPPAHIVRR